MGILFTNGVNMQLAGNLGATDTSFSVIAGQGSQCPEIATDNATDYMLLCITDKNGNREIVKIIEHELSSDTFTIGDSTALPHSASVNGRAYEATFDGYKTALAITASDSHKITMPVTAETLQVALAFAGVTASIAEINAALDGNTATAEELSTLHSSGITNADLVNVHANIGVITPANRTVGDIITEVSAGTMGVIAAAAVGNYFKSAGAATLPIWGKLALRDTGVDVRAVTVTGATTAVTGLGFSPSLVIVIAINSPTGSLSSFSIGFDNGTQRVEIHQVHGESTWYSGNNAFMIYDGSYNTVTGTFAMDVGGYTITATGTPDALLLCVALP